MIGPAAYNAYHNIGTYKPNNECEYCRCKNHCRGYAAEAIAQLQIDLTSPEMLSNEELDFLLIKIPGLKKWCENIWDYAIKKSETTGKKWTNYVLSTGRPTRIFTNEESVIKASIEKGYDEILATSIISVAQAEKLMGKENFKSILGEFVSYKPGKPTLVIDATPNQKASVYEDFKGENK